MKDCYLLMELNLQLITGRLINLKVKEQSSHNSILEKISCLTKLKPSQQTLVKNGQIVNNLDKDLIESPGIIWLIPTVRAGVIIHVKLFSGVILSVEVELDEDTIYNLKEKIAEKQDIETSTQILLFKERVLDDDELKLSAAGIESGDMMHLTLKLDDKSVKSESNGSGCCCFL